MSKIKEFIKTKIVILTKEQKEEFNSYFPSKVYFTEQSISLVVALTQVAMILLFLVNRKLDFSSVRNVTYFSLYIYLLIATVLMSFLYTSAYRKKEYNKLIWLRRIYCFLICMWLMGITALDQMKGNDLSVFSYLLPTMAAVLLLAPLESIVIFGSTWIILMVIVLSIGIQGSLFGIAINSIFVTVLSIFISFRYYRSLVIEFLDRQIIENQYKEIKISNEKLEEIAHVDQLTGLNNRHYLHQTVYPMFKKYINKDSHSLCILMDIDFFKQYNDNYGHLQGDECIKSIAKLIKYFCETHDANAIRYGGEEFLIIKVADESLDASQIANELMESIRELRIPRDDLDIGYVTVSFGLWYDQLFSVDSLESAIQYVDEALYNAKSAGRNCICEANQK
ncbi:GGDEF domain-containing protein [Anaerorhabdus sp.]|uniref:GGDEF domain-containing protein n=1 Tax=Anaerorhabdus sp. TaxID=1872524 RepID=UPI002FCAD84B